MAVNADGSFSPIRPPQSTRATASDVSQGAVVWPKGLRVEGGHSSWNELVRLHFPYVRWCLQALEENKFVLREVQPGPCHATRPITALLPDPSPPPFFCPTVMAVSPCNKRRLDANILLEQ